MVFTVAVMKDYFLVKPLQINLDTFPLTEVAMVSFHIHGVAAKRQEGKFPSLVT